MPEQAIVLSLLNTGVRRAELTGLTWSDFDFKECTVHVNKSLLVFKDFGYQHTTTKESNNRYIDVAPEYMAFMQQYKKRRESIRNQLSSELYGKKESQLCHFAAKWRSRVLFMGREGFEPPLKRL